MSVTAPRDGSRLILSLQGGLWALSPQGGSAKRLTSEYLEPVRPDYSPDGKTVAFQAFKGGTFHIWTMNAEGGNLKQLTTGHGDDREPRWSPDGSKIAFSSDRAFQGSYDVWIVEVATGKLTQLTSSPADEYEPARSPDGAEIAFISGTGANGTAIEAMNLSGGQRTLITAPTGAHLHSPSFSPDSKLLSYTQFAEGKSELYVSGKRVGSAEDVFPFPLRGCLRTSFCTPPTVRFKSQSSGAARPQQSRLKPSSPSTASLTAASISTSNPTQSGP